VKVGILAQDFTGWGGGIDFLRTVIDSLLSAPRAKGAEVHVLIPDWGPKLAWRKLRRGTKQAVRSLVSGKPAPPEFAPPSAMVHAALAEFAGRIVIQRIDVGRGPRLRAVKRLGLDVVLPALHSLGIDFPRPWVAYAYDFQHKYFPEHFTPESRRSRDQHFSEILTTARAAIVNSRAAAADIAKFVPEATARIFALPFSPAPSPDWGTEHPDALTRHGVGGRFFLISNQFWAHKDHATAFAAFRIAAARAPDITLICTGSTVGQNGTAEFDTLMAKVKAWGLEPRVRSLGLIPKRDQIEIMKNARAVVQPTLFEGGPGGGAVYDAVSLGVPVIVSDIPVNLEVEAEHLTFFPAGNADALAEKMTGQLNTPVVRPAWSALAAAGRRRRAASGEVLWNAIDCAIELVS